MRFRHCQLNMKQTVVAGGEQILVSSVREQIRLVYLICFDQITALTFTLLIGSLHRPWVHEDRQIKVKGGLPPATFQIKILLKLYCCNIRHPETNLFQSSSNISYHQCHIFQGQNSQELLGSRKYIFFLSTVDKFDRTIQLFPMFNSNSHPTFNPVGQIILNIGCSKGDKVFLSLSEYIVIFTFYFAPDMQEGLVVPSDNQRAMFL